MPNVLGGRTSGFTGSAQRGKSKGTGTVGGFADKRKENTPTRNPFTGEAISSEQHSILNTRDFNRKSGKSTQGGSDPRPDTLLKKQAGVDQAPVSDVQKALIESSRQRKLQDPALDVAQTILGLMPSGLLPMGVGLGVGRWMGKKVEEDAMMNPGKYKTMPDVPGAVYSRGYGPDMSNRADFPGHNSAPGNRTNSETVKKKKQQLPTLLGASANPLGTFSNPVMIT